MIVTLRTLFISVSALLVCNMAGLAATDVSSPAESLQTEIEASQVEVEVIKKEMTAEQKRSIQNYNELIDQLQSTGGVYQVQLSEVLLSLGATYQSMELHKNAIDAFERSMHISRVNDGLYSLDQISILEKMIESNTKLKDWKNLNKNFHNLFWISKRHYGENNTELLDVIDRIGRWHLKAYEILPASESFSHLVDAENLYNKAVKIIETTNARGR